MKLFGVLRKQSFILISILMFIGLESVIAYPRLFLFLSLSFVALFLVFFAIIVGKSFKAWPLIVTPLFLFLSSYLFILFLDSVIVQHILIAIVSFLLAPLYQVQVYNLLYKKEKYQSLALVHISLYINIIALFLFSSGLMGLRLFLNIPVWVLFLSFVFIIAILIIQFFWINRIDASKSGVYALIIGLLFGELFWAISFLSVHFIITGLILTLFYYLIIQISREHLTDKVDFKNIVRYLIVAFGSIILILFTAQWF